MRGLSAKHSVIIEYVYSHNSYVIYMPNITLSISEELKKEMEKYSSVKWSSAVRNVMGWSININR